MKSPRQAAPRVLVKTSKLSPFQQLANDLVAHRKQKAGPMIVIPVTKRPEQKINTLRQEISRYAKK